MFHAESSPEYVVFVSLIVPAAGAAITGYSAQRGNARTATRSGVLERRLTRVADDMSKSIDARQLRELISKADLVMQGESADWYSSASVQRIEL